MPRFPDLAWHLPAIGPDARRPLPPIRLRHVGDPDAAALMELLHDWRENRSDRIPGRRWFRHFGGSSLIACPEGSDRPLGALLGFASPDQAGEAVIEYVAVEAPSRRKGVGRALVARFEHEQRERGMELVTAAVRPDDRATLTFFAALGYTPVDEPGMRRQYGVPTVEEWDGRGEDRAIVERRLG